MGNLPTDPIMLLSVINMKLRDQYTSLEALCDDLDVSQAEVEEKLQAVGYAYDAASNRFM